MCSYLKSSVHSCLCKTPTCLWEIHLSTGQPLVCGRSTCLQDSHLSVGDPPVYRTATCLSASGLVIKVSTICVYLTKDDNTHYMCVSVLSQVDRSEAYSSLGKFAHFLHIIVSLVQPISAHVASWCGGTVDVVFDIQYHSHVCQCGNKLPLLH